MKTTKLIFIFGITMASGIASCGYAAKTLNVANPGALPAAWQYVPSKSQYNVQGVPPFMNSALEVYQYGTDTTCSIGYVFAGPKITNGWLGISYQKNGATYYSVPNFVTNINAKFFLKGQLAWECAKYYPAPTAP